MAELWDMGGVIVDYRKPPYCFDFLKNPESKIKLIEPYWKRFERGLISGKEFYIAFTEEFGYSKRYDDFIKDFNEGFDFKLNKEVFDFVVSRKPKINGPTLYMISNINEFHFDHINKMWPGVFSNFLRNFYSFRLGMIKPDPKIFLYTKKNINFSVYNTVFIDDKKENCGAAKKIGFTSIQFINLEQLKADLIKLDEPPKTEIKPEKKKIWPEDNPDDDIY
ncbi:MAG: HAD-IA family hydrolase [Patescibacteria group bacterium]|nr:HAD-IA family hydrolase [Patescibacteria group bacterium]